MKKLIIFPLMVFTFGFFSCKKETVSPQKSNTDQVSNDINASTAGRIKNPATNIFSSCGRWVISSLTENGSNLTVNYSSLNVIFCPDNTFSVSNDIMAQNGKWVFGSLNDKILYLDLEFNTPQNTWSVLQGNWKVSTLESSRIMLQTDDGSKTLTLQRPTK